MSKSYRVSFQPLNLPARELLSWMTGTDYTKVNFADDEVWFCCSVFEGQAPAVVIVFEFKSPHDAHLTLAVVDQKALSRQLITALYRTVFSRAGRVTALIEPGNKRAERQVGRMGFKPEGYLRRGYDGIHDAQLWGLLPEECPYLRGAPFRFRTIQVTHSAVERMQ